MIHVVAACLEDDQRFLLCRRPDEKTRGGKWEFPGGKIEPGESPGEALIRELQEELDISVVIHQEIAAVDWDYPDISIHLSLFRCKLLSGVPALREHQAMEWVTVNEAECYDLAPADRALLERISF